ncbi:MAG: hypothetical protein M0C28_10225 [Candidatus Moduliflexus flocculans]|nr:hypothetical protein [Candidatus Moduliflexus flocculans]
MASSEPSNSFLKFAEIEGGNQIADGVFQGCGKAFRIRRQVAETPYLQGEPAAEEARVNSF